MTTYRDDDHELQLRLSADEQAFYNEFEKEANGRSPTTEWGKTRAKAKHADITNRKTRLPMEFIEATPMASWEKVIIDAIDHERLAFEANDIEPGIIKDGRLFRCSKYTHEGTIKAVFLDVEEAKAWMKRINAQYAKVCR